MQIFKITSFSFLLSLFLVSCGPTADPPSKADAYLTDATAVQRGRSIFAGTCAAYCHKLTPGAGDALYLFDCEWKHGGRDQEIFDTIANGVPNTRMIAFGTNFPEGEEDLWKLIAYLKSNRAECS